MNTQGSFNHTGTESRTATSKNLHGGRQVLKITDEKEETRSKPLTEKKKEGKLPRSALEKLEK